MPVNIGELQEPFSEPSYDSDLVGGSLPPFNAVWQSNTIVTVTEAYGTTTFGGSNNYGVVFKIDPSGPPNGANPNDLLLFGSVLYGTTAGILGGKNAGTIFSINTDGSGFTNLYTFGIMPDDGTNPCSGLILCGDTLYGTTEYGGNYGLGTIFSINTNGSNYQVLYSFGPAIGNGAYPCAKLVLCGDTLFGTTSEGGAGYSGTVFQINTNGNSGTYHILHYFVGSDGADPEAELLLANGVLYGTTVSGGANELGTVFSLATNNVGNAINTLHNFGDGDDDGLLPQAGLAMSGNTFYGTTIYGGTNESGTVFAINTNGNYSILHSFNNNSTNDGDMPYAGLTISGSMLYGTTYYGGTFSNGMVFGINTSGNTFAKLYSFQDSEDGRRPKTTLVISNNMLFGTTVGDPALALDPNYGTVFSINTSDDNFTLLSTFSTAGFAVIHTFSGPDGTYPCSRLALSGCPYYGISNIVYGTTGGGGTNGYGTLFKVNGDGTGFHILYNFTSTNPFPQTGLLVSGNTLYGTTTNTIFKINSDGSDFASLYSITNASQLVLSLSGYTLYGTTSNGGANGYGTVFSINTDGSSFNNLCVFGDTNGAFPNGGLELYSYPISLVTNSGSTVEGTLYGTTYAGGSGGDGTVFSVNTDGSGFTILHDFDGTNDGASPEAGLLLTNNNYGENTYLFGTTSTSGEFGAGTLFGINVNGSGFTNLYNFGGTAEDGAQPESKLQLLNPTTLCGTAANGGAYTNGMVFSFNIANYIFTDLYDFTGGKDGARPAAGLTLAIVDNVASIWSLDTAINLSSEQTSNIECSFAVDEDVAVFVNGVLAVDKHNANNAIWFPEVSLTPYVRPGKNDVRAVIGGNSDGHDYFAISIKSTYSGILFTNNVFGTTYYGGNGNGTVFEITPEGYETNLYSFSGQPDGVNPVGDLILSSNILYGVTTYGGSNGYGAIFSFKIGNTNDTILYSFTNGNNDGAYPLAGLVLSNNTLYGTTSQGGTNQNGDGTIFKIDTSGSNYTVLYNFGSTSTDGLDPSAPLLLVSNTLYGTTSQGGSTYNGTIFRIDTSGSNYTVLYNFNNNGNDGYDPQAGLTFFSVSNTLYGTTESGGTNSCGTVFKYSVGNSNYQELYSFGTVPNDGANPQAGLLLSGDTLYGTTSGGGNSPGTIFKIGVDGSGYMSLLSFGSANSDYGKNPHADLLIFGSSLYGTTYQGGHYGAGMVFTVSTNGAAFGDIYDFQGSPDGAKPQGGLCSP